ncbi:MAG: putative sulfate exporter family transporter [Armatimonadota bacterium]
MPWVAPFALVIGAIVGLAFQPKLAAEAKPLSRTLLQVAVVLIGFSLNISQVLKAGAQGFLFSVVSIALVFGLGWLLQKALQVRPVTSLLVSTGTAICGGSAIAAMATAVDAPGEDVTVSVGTVFLLNAVALLVFPPLGHAMGMTATQFGTWAGIAIHDVASVVGAATSFSPDSVAVASSVKLARVLFLVPILLAVTLRKKSDGKKTAFPWFVGLFILASVASSYVPALASLVPYARLVATAGFSLSLFLIGASIDRAAVRSVGFRPLLEGAILWAAISVTTLFVVRAT